MVTSLHRDDVAQRVEEGAQLTEVLPAAECDDEHLPGAINVPLTSLDATSTRGLDRARPVIRDDGMRARDRSAG